MDSNKNNSEINAEQVPQKPAAVENYIKTVKFIAPVVAIILVLLVLFAYTYEQKKIVERNADTLAEEAATSLTKEISQTIAYAKSSIKLSAITIEQSMTSETLENPAEIIQPMVENTPFGAIEYIRADGMNVMNIGEPFDASDREYYIEGMKGNTGTWNNYHPRTAQETLINFYTPLVYNGNTAGVITGYIAATAQLSPLLETRFYGEPVMGLLLDENDMVICSTSDAAYEPDLTLDMFLARYGVVDTQLELAHQIFDSETDHAIAYKESDGEGRVCVKTVPGTQWRLVIVIPATSFNKIIRECIRNSAIAIAAVCIILLLFAMYFQHSDSKKRKAIAAQNAKLEEDNRRFNEANQRAFAEISEIRDIIASADMGTWRIELVENEEPRMYVDDTMKRLLGVDGQERTPEETYTDWFANVTPDAVPSVLQSVERMQQGKFDENTYLWQHPTKGVRYVRCGGTAEKIPGGYALRGYHCDVDEVVRADLAQMDLLRKTDEDKNEYYATLGALGDVFYSLHILDLEADTVTEFNAKNEVKEIVNRKQGATEMMVQIMTAVTADDYLQPMLEFTDLKTIADRMGDRVILSKQARGKNIGWFLASFIHLESDENGRPTKIIYATRSIDEEKRQEERLIHKSQTDELTGFLNRRAYEESIYKENDIPNEENFVYISLDLNGLKVVNDTLGHQAGDELIIGACQCMKKTLGSYGNLYRTGGDEFVAILFCETKMMPEILADFDNEIHSWSGEFVDHLSISFGWTSKEENPNASVRELGAIADKRMYENKSAHYRKSGMDRKGQQDAHKVLCSLYTKILKINLTDDTYQIVNMDTAEQTAEKGFEEGISNWLYSFGKTDQVHPDDLEEYLKATNLQYMRDYFERGKTSLHVFYRRKYAEGYKQVMMEIVPARDYSSDNQSLFLYVKDIDK